MSQPVVSSFDPESFEAFAVLRDMAYRRDEPIPAEELARHVMRVTEGADWPVRRAAMQALLRRMGFAKRDELRVAKGPGGRKRLGPYTTRVPGKGGLRPYRTWLTSVDPIAGSCDCRDFVRSSLGLCKHLLVVLQDLHASERKLAQARKEGRRHPEVPFSWDPVRSLEGPGDWLEGLSWRDHEKSRSALTAAEKRARSAFDARTGRLKRRHLDDVRRRAALIGTLVSALPKRRGKRGGMNGTVRVDPAVAALLDRERAKLAARVETAGMAKRKRTWSRGLKRQLYDYQVEGVCRFLETGRLLLGDDMGLGKTTQAVAACHALTNAGHVRRGLVITPASLKWQWLREWQSVTDVPASIVEGSPAERHRMYRELRDGFLILNYELLLRDAEALRAIEADMVVLDEAQRIKNWATKTAASVKSLRVPYRLVLTGTPMENRLEELASIYDWVDDLALEPKWRLVPHHALAVQQGDRGEVVGARHLGTLRQRIAPTFLRRIRREVLEQLPPRTETRVPVPLTEEQQIAHADLDQPIARLVSTAKRRPLRQEEFLRLMSLLTKQRVICNGIAQLDFEQIWPTLPPSGPRGERHLRGLFAPKLEELRRLVEELVVDQGRKVVIFSQWRRMLRLSAWAVADVLERHGQRAVFFTGAESPKQRTRGVVELHDDPSTSVMFLSDAGGVGLNLQRAASACINLELPWNPAVLEQRISRIYRLGQPEPVEIYNLVSESGIEARIHGIVGAKRELFDGLFDGTSDEIMFTGSASAISQIEKIVGVPSDGATAGSAEDVDDGDWEDEAVVGDADDLSEGIGSDAPPVSASPAPSVEQLLSSLSVRTTPQGGIVLEAPPESAQALASLFGAMSKLLEQQAAGG